MTKIIGLTGGIGSGKSTIAKLFEEEGVPVYFTDDEAKKILATQEVLGKISKEFGQDIIFENTINKKKLSEIVFKNSEKLNILNSIVHPLVKKDFDEWVFKNKKNDFLVKEAAILFESGSYKYCDIIITVTADIETRIKRVMERDKVTREEVIDRINNQWTDEQREKMSDFVIKNEDFEKSKQKFREILKKIKNI